MPRIVLVGAGSVEFTRNLLGDMLTSPALRTADIVLHDIEGLSHEEIGDILGCRVGTSKSGIPRRQCAAGLPPGVDRPRKCK